MTKVAIIGGGPAGYVAAIRGAQLGLEIVLVEKDRLGGTCLNRGCIPTKTYFATAKLMDEMRRAEEFAVVDVQGHVDGPALLARKEQVVDTLVRGIESIVKNYPAITYMEGEATITDPHTMTVAGEAIEVDAIVIATGSKPQMTETTGVDLPGVLTSDELLAMDEVPESLIVVGAGVIGLEFASIYQGLGTQVTMLASRVLKNGDKEIGRRLVPLMKAQGMTFYQNIRAQEIRPVDGGLEVLAKYKDKDGTETVRAQYVLIASGRGPVLEGLNLDEVGVAYNDHGIVVDEGFATNVPGIYAIGDVNGSVQLAHVASAQGVALMEDLAGVPRTEVVDVYPSCTFTLTEVAQVGATEEELKERGVDYTVSKFNFAANGKALAMNEGQGLVKLLVDRDRKLLGAHILGPHASDLIHEAALVMANGGDVETMTKTIHAHPTLGETLHEASLGVFGHAIHQATKQKRKRT